MKLFFFDIETTGLKHWRNGIHQISGCIEINGEVKEYFDFKVKPNPDCTIEDEALKVSNVSRETIMGYPTMIVVHQGLCNMMGKYVSKFDKTDKFFLVGYNNSSFDNQFLRAFFTQCGDNYFGSWFWSDSHDTMVLASVHLKEYRPTMENFQLKTVAKKLGIDVDDTKLHDAQYDIELTRSIYHIVKK